MLSDGYTGISTTLTDVTEHIWADDFGLHPGVFADAQEFQELRNTVAALLLLPADVNRSLQDKPYGAKLAKYASQHLFTASLASGTYANQPQFEAFRTRQQLPFRAHGAFTKAELAERRELIAKLVERIWSPDRLLAFLPEEVSTPAE